MQGLGRALHILAAGLVGLGGALPAHAQTPAGRQEQGGFTCCTFHHSGGWISDANWFVHPRIPAGTPARILEYGEHHVSVEIGGRAMTLGLDYGRRQNLREWAQRMIVSHDPKKQIADWPEAVRDAIATGRVAMGMTREQVIAAIGYPPAHATPSLDQPQWRYWYDTHGTYDVVWDAAGRVRDVATTPSIRFRVVSGDDVAPPLSVTSGPVQMKDLEGLLRNPGGAKK